MRKLDFLEETGVLGVILMLSGVAIFLATLQAENAKWITNPALVFAGREIGLLLMSTGVLSAFFDLFLRRRMLMIVKAELAESLNPDAERLGIRAFYKDRGELETKRPLRGFFVEAENDILVVAIGATRIASHYRDVLRELLRRGVTLRFLTLQSSDPGRGNGEINPVLAQLAVDARKDPVDFRTEVDAPFHYLEQLQEESKELAGSFEVRRHSWVPTVSVVIIDGQGRHGKVLLELHPYGCEPFARPSLELEYRSQLDSLYNLFVRQYNTLWNRATPV